MKDARLLLEGGLQANEASQKDLADYLDVSSSALSSYLNGDKELGFAYLSKASGFLGDFEERMITKACLEFTRANNVKCALEFLSTRCKLDELEERLETVFFKRSDEWVDVYKLVLDFQRWQSEPETLLCDIRDAMKRTKTPELIALLHVLEAGVYVHLAEYKPVLRLAEHNLAYIDGLKDSYIKRSLSVRVYEQLANTYLYAYNQPEKAREYAELVIQSKIGDNFTADAHLLIGTSHWFTDLNAATESLKTAAALYRKIGRAEFAHSVLSNNLELIRTYHGVGLDELDGLSDEVKAYKLSLRGGEAEVLALIEAEPDEAFRLHYLGLHTGDLTYFWRALGAFKKRSDNFLAYLPFAELVKSPDQKAAAMAVY
ncbi:AimR family lysis-lysogeny pheromone receptor [Pontibacillus salipaludis]|uniref:AimR family lysis-lysogeny pheromone receptor n=1 Tax=Pontibacillus salipaludis TaxID=1697394 RepID=UPI0031EE1C92